MSVRASAHAKATALNAAWMDSSFKSTSARATGLPMLKVVIVDSHCTKASARDQGPVKDAKAGAGKEFWEAIAEMRPGNPPVERLASVGAAEGADNGKVIDMRQASTGLAIGRIGSARLRPIQRPDVNFWEKETDRRETSGKLAYPSPSATRATDHKDYR